MTKEQAKTFLLQLNTEKIFNKSQHEAIRVAIKVLEQDNEEIFEQFKKKAFRKSEDILGTDMVDTYMITDYLAELLGVGRK